MSTTAVAAQGIKAPGINLPLLQHRADGDEAQLLERRSPGAGAHVCQIDSALDEDDWSKHKRFVLTKVGDPRDGQDTSNIQ